LDASITIRSAHPSDYDAIDAFLTRNLIIHRHLDWRQPLDWIGNTPYLLMEKSGKLQAILICPSDIENIYWIRLFAVLFTLPVDETFQALFTHALEKIRGQSQNPIIASIAYQLWMKSLLEKNGWKICQEVIQLRWNRKFDRTRADPDPSDLFIRKMATPDIPDVARIDQICFEKIWQHSEDAIARAFEQSAYSTVAEKNGRIAGYQISTSIRNHAHIARLAVLPEFQRQKIGHYLINDVLERFKRPWTREITVNTQRDNTKSLGLYAKLGFEITSDGFPIYKYQESIKTSAI
jgi:ribosomal protein S18 acetylase RimI-like enzyme